MEEDVPKKRIETNYSLFIIPSWGNLLGYPTMGKYVNQDVLRITSDPVIFFSSQDISITSDVGTLYYLFGLGYYYLRFELESGKHIFDSREISCLILPDFVYDFMATSQNVALENDRSIVISENSIRIPLHMESDTKKAFIQGVLTRNIFVPYQEQIIEFMNRIKDPDSYRIKDRGHLILSTYWNDFNKILASEKFRDHEIDGYMNSAPGLNDIIFKTDEYLSMFSTDELDQINDDLSKLKEIYQNLEYDPGFLSSILENAAKELISPLHPISDNSDEFFNKNTIFISAQDRIKSEIVPWSSSFPRKEKKEVIKDTTTQEHRITPGMKSIVRLSNVEEEKDNSEIEIPQNQEIFVLKSLKHKKVESKTLPNPPQGEIEKILEYMKSVIEEDYEMVAVGKAFELARDNIRKIILQSDFMWEMSKYSNIFQRKEPNLSLNERDRTELLEKIDKWIFDLKEEERLEALRLEQERLEKIRKEELVQLEKERIEREKAKKEELDKKQREFESLDPKQKKKLEKEQKKLQKRKEKERKKLEKERKKLEKKKLKEQKKKKR